MVNAEAVFLLRLKGRTDRQRRAGPRGYAGQKRHRAGRPCAHTHLPFLDAVSAVDPINRSSGADDFHGVRRHAHGMGDVRRARKAEEQNPRPHLRQDTGVFRTNGDAHLDRSLALVCGRHHRDHTGGNVPLRIGVEPDGGIAAGMHPADGYSSLTPSRY